MVMFAPGGIAGLLARQQPLVRARQLHRVLPSYAAAALTGLIALTGLSMVIEISYQLAVNASDGPQMSFMHVAFNAASPLPWLIALVLLVGGGALFLRAGRWALMAYDEALAAARARGAAS
jgi:branched-chain amino acid transport system permease protein